MRFKIYLFFILFAFMQQWSYAQNDQYKFSHLDISNGLSDNQVNCFFKQYAMLSLSSTEFSYVLLTGMLALDSGVLIRLEDRFTQSGREKTVRIEIPYSSIIRIREIILQPAPVTS